MQSGGDSMEMEDALYATVFDDREDWRDRCSGGAQA